MSIKKIIALILAVAMLASFAIGCKGDDKPQNDVPAGVVTDDVDAPNQEVDKPEDEEANEHPGLMVPEDAEFVEVVGNIQDPEAVQKPQETPKEPEKPQQPPIPMPEDKPQAPVAAVTLDDAYSAVKNAYGDSYGPDYKVEEKGILSDMYGVNLDDVSEYFVEMAMMSSMVDKFIGIKAVPGKADSVESALKAYLQNEIENGMNYPSNIAKVANAKVIKKGDFVFLMMLGKINENAEATEEEMTKYEQEQIAIGVNALNDCFK